MLSMNICSLYQAVLAISAPLSLVLPPILIIGRTHSLISTKTKTSFFFTSPWFRNYSAGQYFSKKTAAAVYTVCSHPCPFMFPSLSVCVLFPVRIRVRVVSVPMGKFCHAYFQRTSLATDNFQRLFIVRKVNG
jgi:hypothetical protein